MATVVPRGGLFGRVKPLDAILATAQKKSLKRSLGALQLTLLGVGCVIGTGIFVLTSVGAQKAGPGLPGPAFWCRPLRRTEPAADTPRVTGRQPAARSAAGRFAAGGISTSEGAGWLPAGHIRRLSRRPVAHG